MATCRRCGAQLPEEAQFCPNCRLALKPGGFQSQSSTPGTNDQTGAGQPAGINQSPPQITEDIRNIAVLCHLSAALGFLIPTGGNILGPLVVWLMRRKDSPFIDFHGKEVLNFQITAEIYVAISILIIAAAVRANYGILVFIGFFLLVAVVVFDIIMTVIAAVQTNKDIQYRYPLSIRMIR
jgi:hypothetical protein